MVLLISALVHANPPIGTGQILIAGLVVDVDTRPDIPNRQYSLVAVKDFPTAISTTVGLPPDKLLGYRVRARLSGPGLGSQSLTLQATPGGRFEIAALGQEGLYVLDDIHLVDASGTRVVNRDPTLPRVEIQVIDEVIVSEVTTRQLSSEEIAERGIVIDEDNFTVFDFAVALSIEETEILLEAPVIVPNTPGVAVPRLPNARPIFTRPEGIQVPSLDIPNFQVEGLMIQPIPEGLDRPDPTLPGLPGLIIIPGDVGFLNQFFSAILIVGNVAPDGSNLTVTDLSASITLPPGDDALRLGETQAGAQAELPILRVAQTADGEDLLTEDQFIRPGERGKAEFILEGLREGTHSFDIDIDGRLFVASRGEFFDLRGRATGSVVVRNPTFNLVLAHPESVRDGERYSLFVTVSNTSDVAASLFRLRLSERSLSGTVLVPGTADSFTLPSLGPGASETFEFRLESRRTGEVGATYLNADDGLTGSFVLRAGVGETGIPLSPDTLVLPSLADRLPDPPPLERDVVRMLGQAWSAATAPAGSLPEGTLRPSREGVYTRATVFSVLGLRDLFGEPIDRILSDWALDYLETGGSRIDDLYGTDAEIQQAIDAAEDARARAQLVARQRDKARVQSDFLAFDQLRRESRQGRFVLRDLGQILWQEIDAGRLVDVLEVQQVFADSTSGRTPYLSAAIGQGAGGVPARLRITDSTGARAGAVGLADPNDPDGNDGRVRELARAGVITLLDQPGAHMEIAIAGDIDAAPYVVEMLGEGDGSTDLGILCQGPAGLRRLIYQDVPLAPGSVARLQIAKGETGVPELAVDLGGDGNFEQHFAPVIDEIEPDLAPTVLSVQQWGKGAPRSEPNLENGDGFGRMLVVVFSEPVDQATAEDLGNYVIDDNARNRVAAVVLQPDRRIAFLLFEQGIDPAAPVEQLAISAVEDLAGNPMTAMTLPILADPEMNFGGSLSGVVRRASGAPVAGAVVVYSQLVLPSGLAGLQRLETDADGHYAIDFVINNPLGPGIIQAFDPQTGEQDRLQVQPYYAGQQLRGDLILRGYGAIAGRVLDENGSPVGSLYDAEDRLVHAVGVGVTSRTGELTETLVEPDGSFLVSRVPMGAAIVKVDDPGMGRFGVVATHVPAAESLVDVDVIVSSRRGTVAGRVLRAGDAQPAAGVPVIVSADLPSRLTPDGIQTAFGPVAFAYTDAGGSFELSDIPPGDISVESFDQATYEQAEARASLQPDGRTEVTLVYPGAGGILRGLVVQADGDPAPFAEVAGGPSRTLANENGAFTLTDFPIGRYNIRARDAELPTFGSETVEILSGGDIQEIEIRLFPLGTITGRVLEANGTTPVSGVEVLLIGQGGVLARRQSDLLGRFTFIDAPAYSLRNPERFADYTVRATQGTSDGGEARVALRFGGEVANADIVFRGRGPIRGRLVQANGTPAAGNITLTVPRIRIVPAGGDIAAGVIADRNELATSILEGYGSILDEFDVGLPSPAEEFLASNEIPSGGTDFPIFTSEKRVIEVGPDASGAVDGRFELPTQLAGSVSATVALPFLEPVSVRGELPKTTLDAERLLDFGDIVLTSSVGEVSGTVLMPDGVTPVGADVRVTLKPQASAEIEVLTDADGTFVFPLVPTGAFRLLSDTGVPALGTGATTGSEIITNAFADAGGERLLNVRLFGEAEGFLPPHGALAMDLRLQGAGSVLVQVERADSTPVQGAVVTLDTLSDADQPLDAEFGDLATDAAGRVELLPVTEGDFQLSATFTGARGFAAGRMPIQPMDGLSREVRVVLGKSIASDGEVSDVEQFGSIRGTLFEPDRTAFGGQAKITVEVRSTTLTTTTLADGSFSLEGVPAGFITLEALDRNSNRFARADATLIGGDETLCDLTLGTTGSVAGAVLLADGTTRVTQALVTLRPDAGGIVLTQADAQGLFSFTGIPEGPFTLTAIDLDRDLQGTAASTIAVGAEDVELDVLLSPAGAVAGVVYAAGVVLDDDGNPIDADGAPWPGAPVVAFAELQLTPSVGTGAERRDAVADINGEFLFEHLPLDRYQLTARQQTNANGQVRQVLVTSNGETADGSIVLRGLGEVRGRVRNATDGGPVSSARVTLASRSPFARGTSSRLTDVNGAFAFIGQPLGSFSLTAVTTIGAPQLGAAADGTLTADGQILVFEDGDADPEHNALRLEDVGGVVGRILLDGNPLLAAIVTLRRPGTDLVALTEMDGIFTFEGLPLGNYSGEAEDPFTGARNRFAVAITANNQQIDLGDLILDAAPPEVVATDPRVGSSSLQLDGPVAVTFSEAMHPASITESSFEVRVAGVAVAGERTLSADGLTARFEPDDSFPDLTRVRVDVLADVLDFDQSVRVQGVADANGNALARTFSYALTTRDATPPAIVDLQPASGATDVPLDAIVRVEFSEPLDPDSLAGATLREDNGTTIPGTTDLILSDRVLVFTPARLQPDRAYEFEIPGPITDLAGNPLAGGSLLLPFHSLDTLGPTLQAIGVQAGSPRVRGQALYIEVIPTAPDDIQAIDLFVEGSLAATLSAPPFVFEQMFADTGTFSIAAVAVDASGNRGDQMTFDLQVEPDQPPSIQLDPPTMTAVSPGDEISVTAHYSDDVAVTTISVGVAEIPGSTRSIDLASPTASGHRELTFVLPLGLAGGTVLSVQAAARDTARQSTAAAPFDLVVEDLLGPSVVVTSPAPGARVGPAERIDVMVQASDPSGVAEIAYRVKQGASVLVPRTESNVPNQGTALASFSFASPDPFDGSLTLMVEATDAQDNLTLATPVVIHARDVRPPQVQRVTPADATTDVSIAVRPEVLFTEAMAESTLSGIRLLRDGVQVAGSVESTTNARGARIVPENALPLDANFVLTLPPTLTDTAGNGLADAAGNPLTAPLNYGFRTAGFGISTPADGEQVVEGSRLSIEARAGSGLAAAAVVIEVNGDTLATLTAAPYTADYSVPDASRITSLTISATALDAEGAVLANDSVQVEVVAGIRFAPTTLGLAPGASASPSLFLSSPRAEAIDIDLFAAEPEVVTLPAARRFEPGETLLEIPITAGQLALGERARNTVVHARSSAGDAAMTISISRPLSGRDINLTAAPVGLDLRLSPSLGSVGLLTGETRELELVLPEPVTSATTPILTWTRPDDILSVALPTSLAAGVRNLPLTLTAQSVGEAEIGLRIGTQSYRLSVRVGSDAGNSLGPVIAPPVGAMVRAAPSLGRINLPSGANTRLALPLLESPAAAPIEVTVRSSDDAVVTVPETLMIPSGSVTLSLPVTTVGPGSAEVTLTAGTLVRGLTIEVDGSGPIPAIVAPPVMIQVQARPSAGRILLPSGIERSVNLPFLPEPATETVQVQVESLDPAIVSAPASVQIPADSRLLTLPLSTANVDAATRLILSGGGIHRVLDIAVGQVPLNEVPPTLAPAVGIRILP